MADDAGALLVRSGLVSPSALEEARSKVEDHGGTIGEQLVVNGVIGDDALTDFYRSRLLVPQVNPNTLARLPVRVVATIPSDMAIELRAIPVALDAENNLTVAMSDPSDRHAVDEISFFTGTYVVRAVATQMQIAWCLAHYYGHVTALGQRLLQSAGAPPSAAQPVAPEPTPRVARTKGLTGQVDALRRRAIVPISGPVDVVPIARPPVAPSPVPPPAAEAAPAADGVPDKPRARSISGEIRVPGRRAPSIKPVMPAEYDDESGPVITVEVSLPPDDEQTDPQKLPVRRRKAKTDPPELYARAGEVDIHSGPVRTVDREEPRIIIAEDALEPPTSLMAFTEQSGEIAMGSLHHDPAAPAQTIEIADQAESQPILLQRRRPSDAPTTTTQRAPSSADDPDDEVVVLEAIKPKTPRPDRRTQVGIGVLPAATRAHRDTEAGGVPAMLEDTPTSVETRAAPGADDEDDDDATDQPIAPPPPVRSAVVPAIAAPAPVIDDGGDDDDDDDDDDNDDGEDGDAPGRATAVMSAIELDTAIPQRSADILPAHLAKRKLEQERAQQNIDEVDDGWGPPGTTIPPPLLGAVPGTDDDGVPGQIPVPNLDSAPLIIAPPVPPEPSRATTAPAPALSGASAVRAMEDATSRLIELIRTLEHAGDRDDVVGLMIAYLAETHRRAGFFVIKPGATKGTTELSVFTIAPRPAMLPYGSLRLDQPSTLQDVVGTRLPYRGAAHDEASRSFLTSVLGSSPPEILLVPVAVRERVVGVLFAEYRTRHTFDDQLGFASRAAGMALERILTAKRG